jgi:Uma2 family endonuclease
MLKIMPTPVDASLADQPPAPPSVRFNRRDYYRMAKTGILKPDKRYELIEGRVIAMLPAGTGRAGYSSRLHKFMERSFGDRYHIRGQYPLDFSNMTELEPDIAVLKQRSDDYTTKHPRPSDVLLLAEVSESSIDYDRGAKLRIYATAGVIEYWIADLGRKVLTVYRSPDSAAGVYRDTQPFGVGTKVSPLFAPECELDLTWLFS